MGAGLLNGSRGNAPGVLIVENESVERQRRREIFDGEGVTKVMRSKVPDARIAVCEIQPGSPATRMNVLCWHNAYKHPVEGEREWVILPSAILTIG